MHRIAVAICTPIPEVMGPAGPRLAMITPEFHRARMQLGMPTNFNMMEISADRMEVGVARNKAIRDCLEHDPVPEFIFFLDYDVIPTQDALQKLYYRASCFPDFDIFSGVYCCKAWIGEPLIYKENGMGPHWDWAVGDLIFDAVAVHSGLTLIRTKLFQRMECTDEKPWYKTVDEVVQGPMGLYRDKGTEDIYFCKRAVGEVNAKILIDTSVLAGHIDHASGIICGLPLDCPPVKRAEWLHQPKKKPAKKALDLGVGDHKRVWDNHKTVSIDIRPEVKPDFVMDMRLLNFPDNHFDLVASCHTLEHIPRWEQEKAWRESVRVLKPGGRAEHIIPNLEWAAQHIVNDSMNGEAAMVFNVLYGSQDNTEETTVSTNTHFFGYTPRIAKELAEAAGLHNVKTSTYRDHPDRQWEILLTGTKPNGKVRKRKRNAEPAVKE